jgi:hypothetical protein
MVITFELAGGYVKHRSSGGGSWGLRADRRTLVPLAGEVPGGGRHLTGAA